jgi:hypothetical protein
LHLGRGVGRRVATSLAGGEGEGSDGEVEWRGVRVRARQESATRVGGLRRVQRWVGLVGSSAAWGRLFRGRCVMEVDGAVRLVVGLS